MYYTKSWLRKNLRFYHNFEKFFWFYNIFEKHFCFLNVGEFSFVLTLGRLFPVDTYVTIRPTSGADTTDKKAEKPSFRNKFFFSISFSVCQISCRSRRKVLRAEIQ